MSNSTVITCYTSVSRHYRQKLQLNFSSADTYHHAESCAQHHVLHLKCALIVFLADQHLLARTNSLLITAVYLYNTCDWS